MKTGKLFFLFVIFGLLASCQIHQSNFSKRKFLDLKRMNDKEVVVMNNEKEISLEEITNNPNIEDEIESSECFTTIESEYKTSADVEITTDVIEYSGVNRITNSEESKTVNHSQQIMNSLQLADEPKIKKPKTADQLFKLASLFFLLGVLLILIALVGLFESTMREEVGFVSFFLGLIGLVLSSIFAIKGSNQIVNEKTRKVNTKRRDFVIFFGLFFVFLALVIISGNV